MRIVVTGFYQSCRPRKVNLLRAWRNLFNTAQAFNACRGYEQITATKNISETSAQIVRLIKNVTNKFDE